MTSTAPLHAERYSPRIRLTAALLGFTVPGLGQIYQGIIGKDRNRLSKGIFFLASLWGMFFGGMWLGEWKNVYLPPVSKVKPVKVLSWQLPNFAGDLYTRLHYAGQFWVGAAAWPALYHYYFPESRLLWFPEGTFVGDYQRLLPKGKKLDAGQLRDELQKAEDAMNEAQYDPSVGRRWDIAWVYTVIAGVLNLLVIYDAWAGPVHPRREEQPATSTTEGRTA